MIQLLMIITEIYCDVKSKIQARYFWKQVLNMDDVKEEMIKDINKKYFMYKH